eukprot:scaffold194275_cov26-Cyclotella_meneghiniana.AAC.1
MESHVHGFGSFRLHFAIYYCFCHRVIARMYTASRAIMYNAASSASVADDMTFLMMCAMLRMA